MGLKLTYVLTPRRSCTGCTLTADNERSLLIKVKRVAQADELRALLWPTRCMLLERLE